MYKLMSTNINDGNDCKRLSFIFILTANPKNIRNVNPAEAIKTKSGKKK